MYTSLKSSILIDLLILGIVSSTSITSFSDSTATGAAAAVQSSDCEAIASSCPFAQTACVSYWCNYSCTDQSNCCNQADPRACLVSANIQDPCFNIENSVVVCTKSAAADCLCYNSAGIYDPSDFDNMAQSCSQIAATASPSILSLLTGTDGALGYCTRVTGPSNSTASTTSGSQTTTGTSIATSSPSQTIGSTSAVIASSKPTSEANLSHQIPHVILGCVLLMVCSFT